MAMQEPQSEPSMEEILASIRRIISEEDQPAAAEVLDLTEPAEPPADDLMVFDDPPEAKAPEPAPAPAPVAAASPAPPRAPAPAPRAPAPAVAAAPEPEEGMLSAPAAHVTADAFSRLVGQIRISEHPGQTLEGLIRHLVKPMLKEWLDQNLPQIVEAKVEAELDRISRLAR
jgi:cell pole-organizing protein PopZ